MTNNDQPQITRIDCLPLPMAETDRPEARIPISFVRSSLFRVGETGEHSVKKNIIAEKGVLGIQILYTGPFLNEYHFKAWQAVVHLAWTNNGMNGSGYVVSASEILRLMGNTCRDHSQRQYLWRLLEDLTEATLNLRTKRSRYSGSLIASASKDEQSGQVSIRLNPELATLLADETLDNDMLRMVHLGRDQLAIWMHNYLASWGTFRNVPVRELHEMCGTKLDLRRFRYRLKDVMKKIAEPDPDSALGIKSFIKNHYFKNDILYVEKHKTKVRLLTHEARVQSGMERDVKVSDAVQAARSRKSTVQI